MTEDIDNSHFNWCVFILLNKLREDQELALSKYALERMVVIFLELQKSCNPIIETLLLC